MDYSDFFDKEEKHWKLNIKHKNYLQKLFDYGEEPKIIYDIGSCYLQWANVARNLWPDSQIILFEAIEELESFYIKNNYIYNIDILSDEIKDVCFYKNIKKPTGSSYYREIGLNNNPIHKILFNENNMQKRNTNTLEQVVKTRKFLLPDLIKIDVQGSEKDILKGGELIIKNSKHLIVEMQHKQYNENAPLVNETRPYIESLGFKLVDIVASTDVDADYHFININRL